MMIQPIRLLFFIQPMVEMSSGGKHWLTQIILFSV